LSESCDAHRTQWSYIYNKLACIAVVAETAVLKVDGKCADFVDLALFAS